jgi:hypothetical protein
MLNPRGRQLPAPSPESSVPTKDLCRHYSVIDFYFAGASIASRRSGVVSTLSKCG